jgi:hypothetical protein
MVHRRLPSHLAVALAASLVACATASDPGPPSQPPRAVEGERLTIPAGDAEQVEAVAAPAPSGRNRLDFDGDGRVDREEFRNFFARAFHAHDGDDDRVLRGPELASLPPDSAAAADANEDDEVDVAEYVAVALVWFERCDANRDDALDASEQDACD